MNTSYTDTQLKQALAKMLPGNYDGVVWSDCGSHRPLLDTELLHLCWLVEETLFNEPRRQYINELVHNHPLQYHPASSNDCNMAVYFQVHATWQQRTIALAKVKGVEIV